MTTGRIDPAHTDVLFSAKHMMVTTVRGAFSGVEGELQIDEANPAAIRGEIRVDAKTISTQNEQRDGHLRSGDFLLTDEHPTIVAKVVRVEPKGGDWAVTVDLAIRGVTKPVVFDAEFGGIVPGMQGGRHFGATLGATIDRRDFGAEWNVPLGGDAILVGNEVKLEIEVAADEAA